MSIEFSCTQCGQTLRVSEDAAGKRAKCPKCSQVNQIPVPSQPLDDDDLDLELMPEEPRMAPSESPFGAPDANPYSSPQIGYGSPKGAKSGPFAGGGRITNVPTDIGSILNYSIAVWQKNLGILVGATVVVGAIGMALSYGTGAVVLVMEKAGQQEVGLAVNIIGTFASQFVQIYLGIGLAQIMLKLARNQRTDFSDLFNGGPRFLPVLGVSILFGLAVFGGFLLLIIPGIIVLMIWWPCYYLVVDDKSPVMDSFGLARTITQENMGTIVLVWLVGLGVSALGLLACCIGLLFAAPLVGMMYVVSYLMMSGQIPLNPDTSTGKQLF